MLAINDISDETGYTRDESIYIHKITALYYYKKKRLLFVGDEIGTLSIYRHSDAVKGRHFQLVCTQSLIEKNICGIGSDEREIYIYVLFKNGNIHTYQTDQGFQSKP